MCVERVVLVVASALDGAVVGGSLGRERALGSIDVRIDFSALEIESRVLEASTRDSVGVIVGWGRSVSITASDVDSWGLEIDGWGIDAHTGLAGADTDRGAVHVSVTTVSASIERCGIDVEILLRCTSGKVTLGSVGVVLNSRFTVLEGSVRVVRSGLTTG